MNYEEFMKRFQGAIDLESRDDAEAIARITLQTLMERAPRSDVDDVASQLPREIGDWIKRGQWDAKRRTLEQFYVRVGQRTRSSPETGRQYARAMVETLRLAVSDGEMRDLRRALTPEFDPLFEPDGEVG